MTIQKRGKPPPLTPYDLGHGLHEADGHHYASKHRTCYRRNPFPTSRAQLDVAERRQDIRQCAGTCGANQFEYGSKVAGKQRHHHGADDKGSGEDKMPVRVPRLVGEPVVGHDFATYEGFKGEGGQHVQAKATITD